MRTDIGKYLRNIPRGMRLLLLPCIALLTVLSLLLVLAPVAYALPLGADEILADEPVQPQEDALQPQPLLLAPGTPQSTTSGDVRLQNARLTWTPTGTNETQDTYDVMISSSSDVDDTGVLTTESVVNGSNLPTAELDISSLNEGTYYWQVRSCASTEACNPWSQVWSVNLDGTAPVQPIAAITSGMYDKHVVVTGSAEASSKVAVGIKDEDVACETTAAGDGMWTCSFQGEFDYGIYQATVTTTDKAGNQSTAELSFSVKELFVAPQITTEELPPVLEIIPVDETPENKVLQQPVSSADSVLPGEILGEENSLLGDVRALSTDGGVVQATEHGWQVVGVPWFVWLGSISGIFAGWWAFGGPSPRRLGSVLSL